MADPVTAENRRTPTQVLRDAWLAWRSWRHAPSVALLAVIAYSTYSRVFGMRQPCDDGCHHASSYGLIFDEKYYVNAARIMLGHHLPADATYADSPPGSDPNSEHPPLGTLMIAGTMKLFGDNPWGWRTSAVVLGIVALLAHYA